MKLDNEIIYRQIQKEDYEQVKNIICESFFLYKYVDNKKMLETFKNQYINSCLSEKTFSCVAEMNGNVVGVILGKSKYDYKIFSHLGSLFKMLYYNAKMSIEAKIYKCSTEDYANLHNVYSELFNKRKGEFDGVLTLFAITPNCRGYGVGKKLLSELVDYLRKTKTRKIYLFTDTTCNFGFYDSQGFKRLESKEISVSQYGEKTKMDVFLYGYDVNK